MYQFSYARDRSRNVLGQRGPRATSVERASGLLRKAKAAGARYQREDGPRRCTSCGQLWAILIEDLATAEERPAAERCART